MLQLVLIQTKLSLKIQLKQLKMWFLLPKAQSSPYYLLVGQLKLPSLY